MNKKLAFGVLAFVVLIINEVFNDAALAAEVSRYGAGLLALILGSTGAVEQFSGDQALVSAAVGSFDGMLWQKALMDKPWGFQVMILLFIFLQAMDVVTTSVLLAKDGFREANPIMRAVVSSLPVFIVVKSVFVFGVLLVGNWYVLLGATVVSAMVVLNNARLVWRS